MYRVLFVFTCCSYISVNSYLLRPILVTKWGILLLLLYYKVQYRTLHIVDSWTSTKLIRVVVWDVSTRIRISLFIFLCVSSSGPGSTFAIFWVLNSHFNFPPFKNCLQCVLYNCDVHKYAAYRNSKIPIFNMWPRGKIADPYRSGSAIRLSSNSCFTVLFRTLHGY